MNSAIVPVDFHSLDDPVLNASIGLLDNAFQCLISEVFLIPFLPLRYIEKPSSSGSSEEYCDHRFFRPSRR
jgi:hypothetical protein